MVIQIKGSKKLFFVKLHSKVKSINKFFSKFLGIGALENRIEESPNMVHLILSIILFLYIRELNQSHVDFFIPVDFLYSSKKFIKLPQF